MANELMVNGALPVEVTVTGRVDADPKFTLPKFKLTGLTFTCGLARTTPVLVRRIDILGVRRELLKRVRVPLTMPALKAEA
jgi:hypothetical protein